ncbi:Hypothetical protein PHPALM_348 [Phytophthora palmivora]|uniref:Uncharacterized protein n=1 Tax=Phytophthora palmivora TaxID=4796 RepID=A0A2P4YV17_9STRA|nr:Hypothetical protein PHPALM_348 [Phytophthora palmivora]
MAVLGPRAINDDKFTAWSTEVEALGLVFNTNKRTQDLLGHTLGGAPRCFRQDYSQESRLFTGQASACMLLSSHREAILATSACCRQARSTTGNHRAHAFNQARSTMLPLFGALPPADVHLYMDASDHGHAVLDPAHRRYTLVEFDNEERASFVSAGALLGSQLDSIESALSDACTSLV